MGNEKDIVVEKDTIVNTNDNKNNNVEDGDKNITPAKPIVEDPSTWKKWTTNPCHKGHIPTQFWDGKVEIPFWGCDRCKKLICPYCKETIVSGRNNYCYRLSCFDEHNVAMENDY
jgi:hypothetical protein